MRLGLIARADRSGLGIQALECFRALQPERVLVIDVSHLHNDSTHCNKATNLDWYPGAEVCKGWQPDRGLLMRFMHDLDVVLGFETMYSPEVYSLGRTLGVKTVLQPNFEFLDTRTNARPDLYAAPSLWRFDEIPSPKVHLPVPIATDRFTSEIKTGPYFHLLHIVGRPAVNDRNGTMDLLKALRFVESPISVTVRSQDRSFINSLEGYRVPPHVRIHLDGSDRVNYWEGYEADLLVMPRRFGGLCLPVNEALGAGMPIVMPDISPNNTWLPSDWLVPATPAGSFMAKQRVEYHSVDHQALARKIDQFANDAGFYAKAKQEAAELRDQHSWDTLKPKYEKALGELCQR